MKHNFKTGVTYRTRGDEKRWFVGENKNNAWYPLDFKDEHGAIESCTYSGSYYIGRERLNDIIGVWKDAPEEIDVANMWVAIVQHRTNGSIVAVRRIYMEKPSIPPGDTIAILRVSEWEAVKRGERKLIVGEGL